MQTIYDIVSREHPLDLPKLRIGFHAEKRLSGDASALGHTFRYGRLVQYPPSWMRRYRRSARGRHAIDLAAATGASMSFQRNPRGDFSIVLDIDPTSTLSEAAAHHLVCYLAVAQTEILETATKAVRTTGARIGILDGAIGRSETPAEALAWHKALCRWIEQTAEGDVRKAIDARAAFDAGNTMARASRAARSLGIASFDQQGHTSDAARIVAAAERHLGLEPSGTLGVRLAAVEDRIAA